MRLVRIERAVGIRRIDEPPAAFLVGDNVYYAADSVGSEAYGDDTFIHFYAVGEVHGDVVQAERRAHSLLRHSVDEHLDVLAAEAVEHEVHVRTYAAALAELQSGSLGEGLAKAFCSIKHATGVNSHGVVGRVLDAAYACRHYRNLAQLYGFLVYAYVHFNTFSGTDGHLLLHRLVAHGRNNERVLSRRSLYMVQSLGVGGAAVARAFQLHRGVACGVLVA